MSAFLHAHDAPLSLLHRAPTPGVLASRCYWRPFSRRPQPTPFFDGGLSESQVEAALGAALESCYEAISPPCVVGLYSVRLHIEASGVLRTIEPLADLLVVDPEQLDAAADAGAPTSREELVGMLLKQLAKASFPPSEQPSQVTIPFVFD